MTSPQMVLDVEDEITVVGFAGMGGWCNGFHRATGRDVHVAINHDEDAISLHRANHPQTHHVTSDIYEVDLRALIAEKFGGRPVGWCHISPDCRDHSGAKNGKPIRDVISRSLAWIGMRWVGQVRPRIFSLENVPEFQGWCRTVAKRCPVTGRVLKLDGTVAAPGERVPLQMQHLVRVSAKKSYVGRRFKRLVRDLRAAGYEVKWWMVRASTLGAPTKRERLILIARCDGRPIMPLEATHAEASSEAVRAGRLQPFETTGDQVDWSIPIPSIFLTREQARAWGKAHGRAAPKRPLAKPTLQRLARGTIRFIVKNPAPYLAPASATGDLLAGFAVDAAHGEISPGGAKRWSAGVHSLENLAGSLTVSGNGQAVVAAFLARHNGGFYEGPGLPLDTPAGAVCALGSLQGGVAAGLVHLRGRSTAGDAAQPVGAITTNGGHHGLIAAGLVHLRGTGTEADPRQPSRTIAASGNHHGIFAACMFPNTTGSSAYGGDEPSAPVTTSGNQALVAAFLEQYEPVEPDAGAPGIPGALPPDPGSRVVAVSVDGNTFVLTDLGMRMFTPRESARLQGFDDAFILDRGHDGRKLTNKTQLRLIGNAVPPQFAEAMIRANAPELIARSLRSERPRRPRRGRARTTAAA